MKKYLVASCYILPIVGTVYIVKVIEHRSLAIAYDTINLMQQIIGLVFILLMGRVVSGILFDKDSKRDDKFFSHARNEIIWLAFIVFCLLTYYRNELK